MSNTAVEYYFAWTRHLAGLISTDWLFVATLGLYAVVFLGLLAFKLTSYDADVCYASKNVLKYLSDDAKRKTGSLNYFMRGMPKKVYTAWEKYCLEKDGKPSNYLTPDMSYSFGALEKGFVNILKGTVAMGTVFNLLIAICHPTIDFNTAVFLPLMTMFAGILLILVTETVFTAVKRSAENSFRRTVKALDLYESRSNLSVLSAKPAPAISVKLKDNLDKLLAEEPVDLKEFDKTFDEKSE